MTHNWIGFIWLESMRISLPLLQSSAVFRIGTPLSHRVRCRNMATQNPNAPSSKFIISTDAKFNKFQQIFHSESTDGWDKCWEEGLTPWDLGNATPVLVHLLETESLPTGRALVPGCGSVRGVIRFHAIGCCRAKLLGHDVVAIASAKRHVVGLDISDNAIKKASELHSRSPKTGHFTFLKADFFTWCPPQLFDIIFDYTFFCAIEPELRSLWATRVRDLLKPDGELITLMYPIDDHEGGPPFKVSVTDYEEVLHPVGFEATQILDNELAIAPRMGREKLGRWKRIGISQSLL